MNDPSIETYIAASLDGYIADTHGDYSWLEAYGAAADYGYQAFYDSKDTLLMGRRTFDQMAALPEWPYADKPVFVLSHQAPALPSPPSARFVQGEVPDIMRALRESGARHVWHVGGGNSIVPFLNAGAIDAWRIFVMPILLGSGIPLFPEREGGAPLRLVDHRAWPNGVVELRYHREVG